MAVRKERKPLKSVILDQLHWMRKLRSHRFDLAIDLRTGTRGAIIAGFSGAGTRIGRFAADGRLWRNRVFTHLVTPPDEACQYSAEHNLNILFPLGLKIQDSALQITIPSYRKQAAIRLFASEKIPMNRPLLAFHPFSLWKYKEWQVGSCAALIDDIQLRYDVTVVITGSSEEHGRADQVVTRCRTHPLIWPGKHPSVSWLPFFSPVVVLSEWIPLPFTWPLPSAFRHWASSGRLRPYAGRREAADIRWFPKTCPAFPAAGKDAGLGDQPVPG